MTGSLEPDGRAFVCRFCGRPLGDPVANLGLQPQATYLLVGAELDIPEARWPLRVYVCDGCLLMQLDDDSPLETGIDVPQSGSVSPTIRAHSTAFVDDVLSRIMARQPRTLEMASHGGYLAWAFRARGVETTIIEANRDRARAASAAGFHVVAAELDSALARDLVRERGPADLIVDNYRLAHLANPDGVLAAMSILLAPGGMIALEFDHALHIVAKGEFDAIRHGHLSYFSLASMERALGRHGLVAVDAEAQPVYGGAVRLVVRHATDVDGDPSRLRAMREQELAAGIGDVTTYRGLRQAIESVREDLTAFLVNEREAGRTVAAYGASSRGNTLLNTFGITSELVAYVADVAPSKHGRYLPGSHVPVVAPEELRRNPPSSILLLAWDLADEIREDLRDLRALGCRLVLPLPRVKVLPW